MLLVNSERFLNSKTAYINNKNIHITEVIIFVNNLINHYIKVF